ncbi:uncharacterized protein LOC115545538 isoform X1 [Gadus morhua]|uniref:Uncharacterized LOC115545538 n=3 Tax=Gadus TaxID=8048 RepID=A0A8C5C7H8_GADMO|nr:uncharacterized protein LOC115545538 isoform X1 [Gadus morhua]
MMGSTTSEEGELSQNRGKMFSVQTLIVAALLAELGLVVESSFGEGARSYSFDLSNASDLNRLYNSPVHRAVRMRRPLGSMSFQLGPLSHSGVKVTLRDGSTWLVHKGDGFGISSQTVVVDARHMSTSWQILETKDFRGTKTVGDFVRAGGSDYSLLFDNCHFGADRMMDQ